MMKAIVCGEYGPPEVLQLGEVKKPTPGPREILIKMHATAASAGDVRLRKPDPFAVRFVFGLRRPKYPILGIVVAGEVEVIGSEVTTFKEGDRVFGSAGMTFGTYAEYICLPETAVLSTIPDNMTYEEAAAVPFGGTTALFFLRRGNVAARQKILVYGASGAIGTSAVQIARALGAEVSGVCSSTNVEMVGSLGAERVFDYTKEDFSQSGEKYDAILDTVGESPFPACVKALKEKGNYLRVVHTRPADLIRGMWVGLATGKNVIGGVTKEKPEDMSFLKELIEAGKLKPVIDRTYPLEQIADAHAYVEKGHKKGNVIITF